MNKKKDNFVTKKYLDKKLGEHAKIIVTAVDGVLNKRLIATEIRLDKKLEKVKEELKTDINNVRTLIDGYVKAQEEFKQEFVIMKEEVKQIKQVIKEKLGVEIRII